MPKYMEIADVLRKRIKDGTYPKDSLLPYQTELVEEFGVSRMTIKNAVNILIMEGLLLTKRGLGTKVLNHSFWGKRSLIGDRIQRPELSDETRKTDVD